MRFDCGCEEWGVDLALLCLKSGEPFLDRVSTGSGSDLVSDQHAIFPKDFDSHGFTMSLPLPVLTRSKCNSYFWGKVI